MASTVEERAIDELVRGALPTGGPGCAVLVLDGARTVHAKGYGLADVAARRSITEASSFDLASVSKQLTAVAVLRLAERGLLSVEARVADVLPAFTVPALGRPILVRDLLWHTSGLADYTGDAFGGTAKEFEDLTTTTFFAWLVRTRPESAPGLRHEYNNSNYVLLARLVEELTRERFDAYLRADLLGPLGMVETVFLTDHALSIPNRVTGYTRDGEGPPRSVRWPSVVLGDGNVFTTIGDLARWSNGLRDGRLLSREWLEQAFSNGILDDGTPIEDEDGYGYGFGFRTDEREHDTCVWHSGSWAGTATYLDRWLERDVAFAVLSNDDTFDATWLGDALSEV